MSIDIPESVLSTASSQAEAGGFGSVSDYVCQLIRADQLRVAKENLERELIRGLESGEPTLSTPERWEALREEIRQRHAQRQGQDE